MSMQIMLLVWILLGTLLLMVNQCSFLLFLQVHIIIPLVVLLILSVIYVINIYIFQVMHLINLHLELIFLIFCLLFLALINWLG